MAAKQTTTKLSNSFPLNAKFIKVNSQKEMENTLSGALKTSQPCDYGRDCVGSHCLLVSPYIFVLHSGGSEHQNEAQNMRAALLM